jgi:hypothetical protein
MPQFCPPGNRMGKIYRLPISKVTVGNLCHFALRQRLFLPTAKCFAPELQRA